MNPTNPNQSKLSIRMNPKLTGFIRIEISDLFGLFLNWLRVYSDGKFALESFGITRFSSESDSRMAWNSADWFGMNFNPELLPGWTYMTLKILFNCQRCYAVVFLKGMWYFRKLASLCEQLGPLSTCLCPKYINFFFKNLGNGREDENGRR